MMRFGELLIILVVVLILFGGGGKLSNIMGDLGKGLKAFKNGMKDDESAVKKDDTTPSA